LAKSGKGRESRGNKKLADSTGKFIERKGSAGNSLSGKFKERADKTGRILSAYPGDPIPEPLKSKPKKK
jgi:hypothetical protein